MYDSCNSVNERTMDVAILSRFYAATGGSQWRHNAGWLTGVPCANVSTQSSWYGVACQGGVAQLSLAQNGLRGTLPSQLASIPTLQALELADNTLYGTIPSLLWQQRAFQFIDVYNNRGVSGTIPTEVGNLPLLSGFSAGGRISGTVPRELYKPTLTFFNLNGAKRLSGTLSCQLGSLARLAEFDVRNSRLSGFLPTQ